MYLDISGHQGVTWWLAHNVTSVQDPKHVHHPWTQVTLSGNTRIGSVSDVYLTVSGVYLTVFDVYLTPGKYS